MRWGQYIWILCGISLMLTSGTLAGNLLQNVALNKMAVQSSQNGTLGTAGKAVDGNRDAGFEKGSCTLTNQESDPWWMVFLGSTYKITAVMITNRDEQENSLDGAEIWIGNSAAANDTKHTRCGAIAHIPGGRTFYISCGAAEGCFLSVRLPGSNRVLSLCEVEVFPIDFAHPLPNVALRGHATQSSTLSSAVASKAIDGRRNSFYSNWSCSHTAEDEASPWWRVDLRRTFTVSSVKITNRGDCCAERLDGAEIRIGNSLENNGNNNPRCALISHIRAGKTYTFTCDGGSMEGRFVNVIIPGEGKTLTLCEVEVYGAKAVEALPNVALNKPAAQSTVIVSGDPFKAVSGCRKTLYMEGCCTHTSTEADPWWRVDLLAVHRVSAVTITNRQDCCSERLEGAEIRIGNSSSYHGDPRCAVVSFVEGTPTYIFQCEDMEGRYVDVIIPGISKTLTLCEVEVYASLAATEAVTPSPSPTPPPPPPPPSVSVMLGGRNVTVVGARLCWSDALLYCRRHHWDLLSLRSREEQSEVERLLGRSPVPLTDHVWLGLRRYVMADRWFWMSGDAMKFTKWLRVSAPHHYSSPCGGVASGGRFLWDQQPCDRLLNFVCQSGAEAGAQRVYFHSTKDATSP